MKPTPKDWPRISSNLYYEDPQQAIDWLCRAFSFQVRLKVEDDRGDVVHSELTYGEGVIMVGAVRDDMRSPKQLGGNTQNMFVYVDDIDAHYARAVETGASVIRPIMMCNHGEEYWTDRDYGVRDPEGHGWWFAERVRTAEKKEVKP